MYFSVVIPTYNPKRFLNRMLDSITQNDCVNDIEVIIADDCSEEDFSDICNEYKNILNIRTVVNAEHYGAPLLGRQTGANIATGKWICFADQDDFWLANAFDLVKEHIEQEKCENYLITDFYDEIRENEVVDVIHPMNWTHGKFYENKFLKEHNIHYLPKIKYCEDIALSVSVCCELTKLGINHCYFPCFTYVWVQRPDSLSRANGMTDLGYFFKSFPDYIKGTLGQYIEYLEKYKDNEDMMNYLVFNITDMMFHFYFYYQGLLFTEKDRKIPKEYYTLLKYYFNKFMKLSGIKMKDWFDYCDRNYIQFSQTRDVCMKQIPFIEREDFYTWMVKLQRRG